MKKITFQERVLGVVRGIKKGKVHTYKQIAFLAGSPLASRAVGNIMQANFDKTLPCHRVIRSDGKLGGYNRGGTLAKARKLKQEGWRFS